MICRGTFRSPTFFPAIFGTKIYGLPGVQKTKDCPGRKVCMKHYLSSPNRHTETLENWRKQDLKYGVHLVVPVPVRSDYYRH